MISKASTIFIISHSKNKHLIISKSELIYKLIPIYLYNNKCIHLKVANSNLNNFSCILFFSSLSYYLLADFIYSSTSINSLASFYSKVIIRY